MLDAVIDYHERELRLAQEVVAGDPHVFTEQARRAAELRAAAHSAMLVDLRAAQQALATDHPQWMHVERGGIYSEIGKATAQCVTSIHDGDKLTLYRAEADGKWWVRPPGEFRDGRFVPVERAS
jgi:hypothetical protein